MVRENSLWAEKYRPTTLDTFVGNVHLKEKLQRFLDSGDVPHLLLYGPAGTGKTTLGKMLHNSIECDHMYINASDKGGVDFIRNEIIPFASSVGFKDLKLVILDEADFLTPNAQAALRNTMETFSRTTRFILTCNYVERIIDPVQSRCQIFEIIPPSKKEVAVHATSVLARENVEFDIKDIALIVNSSYPDIRRVINNLQKQSVDGTLTVDTHAVIENDYKLKILEILKTDNKKDAFKNSRQLLADNSITQFSEMYAFLYSNLDDFATDHLAQIIMILNEGQKADALVIDKEICFMATLIEILNEIK
jgi:DNA polymerase III delta prime subunit